jgi:hypothetical protein
MAREADIAAIDRYAAARTVDPAPIARALREDARVLDEARRRLATLKPAAAARWRKELNQLAGATARVNQLRQRAEELAKAEATALAVGALHRAERTAAQQTLDASAQALDGLAPLVAAAPVMAIELARQRDGVEALTRELAGAIEALHAAVVEEIAKPTPTREALRQVITRLEAVSGARADQVVPVPRVAPVALATVAAVTPAGTSALVLPVVAGTVEPLEPEQAPTVIAQALERANAAIGAHAAALAGAANAKDTLERAAAPLGRTTATIGEARERLAALATRLAPDAATLAQASAAASVLMRSVDVAGVRTRVVACLGAAAS